MTDPGDPDLANDAGYSLAETGVSLALLTIVVAPLIAVTIRHMAADDHIATLAALAHANVYLENAETRGSTVGLTLGYVDPPWHIIPRVHTEGDLASVDIIVSHAIRTEVSVTLSASYLRRPETVP